MAVYDSRHLQYDCQEPGSSPEPYARQSSMGHLYPFFHPLYTCTCVCRCQKRRTVLRKGHVAYSVYFVFSGAVSVDFDPDDHSIFTQKRLITLRKGAVFGVSRKICSRTEWQSSLKACTACRCCSMIYGPLEPAVCIR